MSRTLQNAVVEALEVRSMMSASPLTISEASYAGGTQLRIIGTAGDDQITVSLNETGLKITNGDWSTTAAGNSRRLRDQTILGMAPPGDVGLGGRQAARRDPWSRACRWRRQVSRAACPTTGTRSTRVHVQHREPGSHARAVRRRAVRSA